nr:MAG TPA: hypothetical protein [Caudoviricetes sp.]
MKVVYKPSNDGCSHSPNPVKKPMRCVLLRCLLNGAG